MAIERNLAVGGTWRHANKAMLLVRVVVGLLFVGHGCQKLLGWFGGKGLADAAGGVEKLGLRPAIVWAALSGGAELVGGVLLVLGLLTPLAAGALVVDMGVAAVGVHLPRGLWSQAGGYEYNLVLVALLCALGLAGAGAYALDRRLGTELPRPHAFGVALGAGLLAVALGLSGLV